MTRACAHKINNTLGQILIARRMGKTRIIAETAPASMVWPRPLPRRCLALNALFIWAPRCAAPVAECVPYEINGGRSYPG